jgi:hypothetical protein
MLISADNHAWPAWAPDWLRTQVESPDCTGGTHPALRQLAKWLTIYFGGHERQAERWLKYAAQRCDRDVDEGEVDRLLAWAEALFGNDDPERQRARDISGQRAVSPELEEIYCLAIEGPRLAEYRASSPLELHDTPQRTTELVLRAWAEYSGIADPLVCFGSRDAFWTRPLSAVAHLLHIHEQIVPSPMRAQYGLTADGHWSEHTKSATGERTFLCIEFDFARTTPKGKPTICGPLLDRTEAAGLTVLDLNAALIAHLAKERPIWMTVYSGGKSLQGWVPCRGVDEEELHRWFHTKARALGACSSTWTVSQFVRMPDGSRAPNREGKSVRQSIVYYNPQVLIPKQTAPLFSSAVA